MKSILEELFYGNICPSMDFRSQDAKARKLMEHLANHHEALNDTLTEKQQELLEKFDDCYGELTDINEREIFIYAFRLGARVAIEVLYPDLIEG